MRWWDWDENDVRAAMPIICSGDVGGLYRFWQDHVADPAAAAH
jgi:chloramphenicol O-acetyltransferase type B